MPAKNTFLFYQSKTTNMKKEKVLNVVSWIFQVLVGLQMLVAGQSKFTDAATWGPRFEKWGYFDNFFYLIGAIEVIAGVMLFIPKTVRYGAIAIVPVMVGALITHLLHDETILGPALPLALLAVVLYVRLSEKPIKLS